jgi:hypothetical protein
MPLKLSSVRTTLVAALLLALSVTSASAGRPVPGVDVIVKKNPGGLAVGTVTTDKDGKFEFAKLKPGKYLLDLDQPQTRDLVTTRSNIKHRPRPGVAQQGDPAGVEVVEISIEFTAGKGAKPHAPLEIEITGKSGTIKGIITRDEPAKPSEPKAADPKASKPKAK